jgi:hypothetical protein
MVKRKKKNFSFSKMAATAVFLVETSHHEGYCSGAECEYEQREVTFEVKSVDQLANLEMVLNGAVRYHVKMQGSGYCDVIDPRAQEIGWHNFRVTLLHNPFYTKSALKG